MAIETLPPLTFHHGGISVPDLDQAIAWYGKVLGFEEERRFPIPKAKAQVAMVRNGDLRFELFEVAGALPLPPDRRTPDRDIQTHGNKHVAFEITDLDAFLAHAETHDVDVVMVIRETFGSGCYIRDCFGNLIEFVVRPSFSPEEA